MADKQVDDKCSICSRSAGTAGRHKAFGPEPEYWPQHPPTHVDAKILILNSSSPSRTHTSSSNSLFKEIITNVITQHWPLIYSATRTDLRPVGFENNQSQLQAAVRKSNNLLYSPLFLDPHGKQHKVKERSEGEVIRREGNPGCAENLTALTSCFNNRGYV